MLRGRRGYLDAGAIEVFRRLVKKESVRRSELEQLQAWLELRQLAQQRHALLELAVQHCFGAEVIAVAIGLAALEVRLVVDLQQVEAARDAREDDVAVRALQDVEAGLVEQLCERVGVADVAGDAIIRGDHRGARHERTPVACVTVPLRRTGRGAAAPSTPPARAATP